MIFFDLNGMGIAGKKRQKIKIKQNIKKNIIKKQKQKKKNKKKKNANNRSM